jgi:hypothetical protein
VQEKPEVHQRPKPPWSRPSGTTAPGSPRSTRELAGVTGEVEEETLDAFLRAVPPEDKPNFDKLAAVLREQLTGIKVYKVGDEAEKQAFVVGKTSDGKWAGLKTTVVET